MKTIRISTVAALTLCITAYFAFAQSQGPQGDNSGPGGTVAPGGQMGAGNISQGDFNKLQDDADSARRLTKADKGKTLADLLAEDKAAAGAIAAAMPLSCDVKEAVLAAEGDATVEGKTVKSQTYEAACANGMGYFLVSPAAGKPYAISCFAADTTRAADVAAGRKPSPVCHLKANEDLNAVGTAMMSSLGKHCTVKDHRWVGQNAQTHTEFDEFACDDHTGYIVVVPLLGKLEARAVTCHDSAVKGLPCKLSDNGTPIVSAKDFLDALAQHNVACDANKNGDIHGLGQENKLHRYVVEFRCSQRPQGTVAFIPLAGNNAPFEVLDCKTAALKHGAICTLMSKN